MQEGPSDESIKIKAKKIDERRREVEKSEASLKRLKETVAKSDNPNERAALERMELAVQKKREGLKTLEDMLEAMKENVKSTKESAKKKAEAESEEKKKAAKEQKEEEDKKLKDEKARAEKAKKDEEDAN